MTGIGDYRSRKAAVLGTQWDRSVGKARTELRPVSLTRRLEQRASGAHLGDQHAEGSSPRREGPMEGEVCSGPFID